jgi:histidinol-phosphate aminotransferase
MTLLRSHLSSIKPYVPTPAQPGHRLHLNESPEDLPHELKSAVVSRLLQLDWSHYPEEAELLIAELAAQDGWRGDGVVVGNGSNEMLQVLIYASLGPGEPVVLASPSFSVYGTQVRVANAKAIEVPLRRGPDEPFAFDVERIARAARMSEARVTLLASPNNPTGTPLTSDEVRWLHDNVPGVLVVDEAYRHFARQDFAPLLGTCPRLVLMRTFSKSFAAAALRLGYILAAPEIAIELRKVVMPYNLSVISTAVARELLRRPALVEERARFVIAERDRMAAALATIPHLRVERSLANFVVFEHATRTASTLASTLARRGVLVRDLTGYDGCERCLRASVGPVEANEALLNTMREIA